MTGWARAGGWLDRLGELLVGASAFLLLLMVILLGVEIGNRAIFRSSTQVADEYSGYLFTWMTLCCFVYAQRTDRFLRVDALRNRFAPRGRAFADAIAALLAAALCAILAYATWSTFSLSLQFGSVSIQPSRTPLYLPQMIMPIGLGLLVCSLIHTAVGALLQAFGYLPLPEPRPPATASCE